MTHSDEDEFEKWWEGAEGANCHESIDENSAWHAACKYARAAQRVEDAEYMQHKKDCRSLKPKRVYVLKCSCGLKAIEVPNDTQR